MYLLMGIFAHNMPIYPFRANVNKKAKFIYRDKVGAENFDFLRTNKLIKS